MAIIYYPQGAKITERNTASGSQTIAVLNVFPNSIFYFDPTGSLQQISQSIIADTASHAFYAEQAGSASYLTGDGEVSWSMEWERVSPPDDHRDGRLFYCDTYKCLTFQGYGTTSLQIGQEQYMYVHNKTGTTIPNGAIVCGNLSATGYKPDVKLAIANYDTELPVLGMATMDIPNGEDGFITTYGVVNDLDTETPGYNEGDVVYLSTTVSGSLTTTEPSYPYAITRVGLVTRKHLNQGSIFIRIEKHSVDWAYTASYAVSASNSDRATSASFATTVVSASHADTASHAINALSASYALQASNADSAVTASYLNPVSFRSYNYKVWDFQADLYAFDGGGSKKYLADRELSVNDLGLATAWGGNAYLTNGGSIDFSVKKDIRKMVSFQVTSASYTPHSVTPITDIVRIGMVNTNTVNNPASASGVYFKTGESVYFWVAALVSGGTASYITTSFSATSSFRTLQWTKTNNTVSYYVDNNFVGSLTGSFTAASTASFLSFVSGTAGGTGPTLTFTAAGYNTLF